MSRSPVIEQTGSQPEPVALRIPRGYRPYLVTSDSTCTTTPSSQPWLRRSTTQRPPSRTLTPIVPFEVGRCRGEGAFRLPYVVRANVRVRSLSGLSSAPPRRSVRLCPAGPVCRSPAIMRDSQNRSLRPRPDRPSGRGSETPALAERRALPPVPRLSFRMPAMTRSTELLPRLRQGTSSRGPYACPRTSARHRQAPLKLTARTGPPASLLETVSDAIADCGPVFGRYFPREDPRRPSLEF